MAQPRTVRLVVEDAVGLDRSELDEATLKLRQALPQLDVEDVTQARGTPPEGAKAGESVTVGALLVSLLVSSNTLKTLIDTLQWWLAGSGPRSVRLELDGDVLEVSGVFGRPHRELIDLWIQRHATRAVSTRAALLVVTSVYDDPAFSQLRAPIHDADALAEVLGDPSIGGFAVEKILRDKPRHEVEKAIDRFIHRPEARRSAPALLLLPRDQRLRRPPLLRHDLDDSAPARLDGHLVIVGGRADAAQPRQTQGRAPRLMLQRDVRQRFRRKGSVTSRPTSSSTAAARTSSRPSMRWSTRFEGDRARRRWESSGPRRCSRARSWRILPAATLTKTGTARSPSRTCTAMSPIDMPATAAGSPDAHDLGGQPAARRLHRLRPQGRAPGRARAPRRGGAHRGGRAHPQVAPAPRGSRTTRRRSLTDRQTALPSAG